MPDVFDVAKRSDVMSRIRARGNKTTELAMVAVLRSFDFTGWRRHLTIRISERNEAAGRLARAMPPLVTKPDFVFRRQKVVIYVDGCFWHGCPLHMKPPGGNATFWSEKIAGNKARDRRANRLLRRAGWRVVRVWEHELKENTRMVATRIRRALRERP